MNQGVSISEHTSFSEGKTNVNRGVQKAKRKVQFSLPLEYWREFDKETGELDEVKDSVLKESLSPLHCKNVETFNNNLDGMNSGQNIDCKGGAKTQSIKEVIQTFQKRQDKRIDALKQAEEKTKHYKSGSKQNVKLASSALHIKQLNKRSLLCNVANRSKLATDGKCLWNFHKESSLIQSYCTYSFSPSLSMLSGFKVTSPLPLAGTTRKLYDERLLPARFDRSGRLLSSTKPRANGLPPVVGKLPTPYIVQLFD